MVKLKGDDRGGGGERLLSNTDMRRQNERKEPNERNNILGIGRCTKERKRKGVKKKEYRKRVESNEAIERDNTKRPRRGGR